MQHEKDYILQRLCSLFIRLSEICPIAPFRLKALCNQAEMQAIRSFQPCARSFLLLLGLVPKIFQFIRALLQAAAFY
jgi:hypothetical protein